jgi:hypothetical protein
VRGKIEPRGTPYFIGRGVDLTPSSSTNIDLSARNETINLVTDMHNPLLTLSLCNSKSWRMQPEAKKKIQENQRKLGLHRHHTLLAEPKSSVT